MNSSLHIWPLVSDICLVVCQILSACFLLADTGERGISIQTDVWSVVSLTDKNVQKSESVVLDPFPKLTHFCHNYQQIWSRGTPFSKFAVEEFDWFKAMGMFRMLTRVLLPTGCSCFTEYCSNKLHIVRRTTLSQSACVLSISCL